MNSTSRQSLRGIPSRARVGRRIGALLAAAFTLNVGCNAAPVEPADDTLGTVESAAAFSVIRTPLRLPKLIKGEKYAPWVQGAAFCGSNYGIMYVSDPVHYQVLKVNLTTSPATSTSFVGAYAVSGDSGDGGPAIDARLVWPRGLACDSTGSRLFIADAARIRVVDLTKATPTISTYAGTGIAGYAGDGGLASSAQVNWPAALDFSAGALYFTDTSNHVVRKIVDSSRIITTVAGTGTAGYSGDGSAATSAQMNEPSGIAISVAPQTGAVSMYITDTRNDRIRKVAPNGTITTIAGSGAPETQPNCNNGGGTGLTTNLWWPSEIALNNPANPTTLYITDTRCNAIRGLNLATGAMTTEAGNPGANTGYGGDGVPPTDPTVLLNFPKNTIMNPQGGFYILDTANNAIRLVN